MSLPWRIYAIVIVIIVVAFVILTLGPAINKTREAAARTQVMNNLRQMGLATHSCNDTNRKLPPAFGKFGASDFPTSLHVYLTPFIESSTFYRDYIIARGGNGTKDLIMPPFNAPLDYSVLGSFAGIQNFAANLRVFSEKGFNTRFDAPMPELGIEEPGAVSLADLKDGTANVIVFATKFGICGDGGSRYAAEVNSKHAAFFGQNPAKNLASAEDAAATFQLRPFRDQCLNSPLMAQGFDDVGLIVGLADGNVKMLKKNIPPMVWNYLLQPNDGNEVGVGVVEW